MVEKANKKSFPCPKCKKVLTSNKRLARHVQTHTMNTLHICETCDKSFRRKCYLNIHRKIHLGFKPFQCTKCEYASVSKRALDIHIRTHDNIRLYACDICEKKFTQSGSLKIHKRIHSKERPYQCSTCEKTFAQKSAYDVHLRVHSGERPHACIICPMAFTSKGDLTRHIMTHTGEKKYTCEVCEAGFTTRCDLNRHLLIHTNERPYVCTECNRAFGRDCALKVHTEQVHSKQGKLRQKRQEQRIHNLLVKHGISFDREFNIDFTCMMDNEDHSRARVDFLIYHAKGGLDGQGGYVILEADEGQHRFRYTISCDMERMARIVESTSIANNHKPILFLRYNPGTIQRVNGKWVWNGSDFTEDGVPCYVGKSDREAQLVSFLKSWEFPESEKRVYIKYMFYDQIDKTPSVTLDPGYHPEMAQCVI